MSKSYNELPPSIERRLAAWISLIDQRARTQPRGARPTITISRRFGCDAFSLSEHLKQVLDEATGEPWTVFDRALLERVSQDEHLPVDVLQNLGAGSRAVDAISVFVPSHATQNEVFRSLARHLIAIAGAGNAIIVGRGGAILTQHLSNCYHFRLDASVQYCVAATMERLKISEEEATQMLREYDTTRERFLEHSLHASVTDITHYHAVFNRERNSLEDIARCICTLVEHRWQEKGYFKRGVTAANA